MASPNHCSLHCLKHSGARERKREWKWGLEGVDAGLEAGVEEMMKITCRDWKRGRESRQEDKRKGSEKEVTEVASTSRMMKIKMRIRKTGRAERRRERGGVVSRECPHLPFLCVKQYFFLSSPLPPLQWKKTCSLFAGHAVCAWCSPYWSITLTEDRVCVGLCARARRGGLSQTEDFFLHGRRSGNSFFPFQTKSLF